MTREEAIIQLRLGPGINEDVSEKYNDAVDMAIEALQTPPISQRSMYQAGYRQGREEALEREPSEDLIKRSDAIEAIEIVDWYHQNSNKDMVHGANDDEHQAWYKADDVYKALEAVPSADRPKGEFDGMIFSTDKYMAFIDKKEIHIMRKDAHKVTVERTFNTEEDEE